jgi:hypothetical protein
MGNLVNGQMKNLGMNRLVACEIPSGQFTNLPNYQFTQ